MNCQYQEKNKDKRKGYVCSLFEDKCKNKGHEEECPVAEEYKMDKETIGDIKYHQRVDDRLTGDDIDINNL